RSRVVDPVAERGLADLRARIPREAHLLMIRSRTIGTFAAVLCALFAGTRPAMAAVADYLGRPVASVHLTVEGHETTESMLTQVVETAPGQPLSMSQVRSSIAHLFSLGRFEDVRVDATLDNEGVVLRYDLIPI